jgi:hypothetical protein
MNELIHYIDVAVPFLAFGAAWGGAKVTMNGIKERVSEVRDDVDEIEQTQQEQHSVTIDRLARLETKIDILLEKK